MAIQQMLVIGGVLLLSYLALSYHSSTGYQTSATLYNEAVITGTGIAQSFMEEIQSKAFDEKTTAGTVDSPDSLTNPFDLGPESGEPNATKFDDVDDYNDYRTTVTHGRLGDFDAVVNVFYVNTMSPGSKNFARTFSKRVDIYVITYVLKDTLKFNQVISY